MGFFLCNGVNGPLLRGPESFVTPDLLQVFFFNTGCFLGTKSCTLLLQCSKQGSCLLIQQLFSAPPGKFALLLLRALLKKLFSSSPLPHSPFQPRLLQLAACLRRNYYSPNVSPFSSSSSSSSSSSFFSSLRCSATTTPRVERWQGLPASFFGTFSPPKKFRHPAARKDDGRCCLFLFLNITQDIRVS